MDTNAQNIFRQSPKVSSRERSAQKNQKPCVLWFTGLSGAGKSILAEAMEQELNRLGFHTYLLDGDNIRQGLNKDLSFSDSDRVENIRRIGEVSKLFVDAGLIVLSAFISPFEKEREMVKGLFKDGNFVEIYVSTALAVCEERDPKGLYKKARAGEIQKFTGIDSVYEAPLNPDLTLDTSVYSVQESVSLILAHLKNRGFATRVE